MSKKTLIIIGSVIIAILLIIWGYILFFNNTNTENIDEPANFPESGLDSNTPAEGEEVTFEDIIEESRQKLTHITTRKLAGFSEILDTSSLKPISVYYIEQGTGHIFSYDLESKEESRVSGTTLSKIDRAVISPKGDYIAFSEKSNTKNHPFILGEINIEENRVDTFNFSKEVDDFEFDLYGDNLFYSTRGAYGLEGYSYNLASNSHKQLFSLPFFEATVIWSKDIKDPIYVYPKPSYLMDGAMYEIKNGNITRLPASGKGLTGLANSEIITYSTYNNKDKVQENVIIKRSDKTKKSLNVIFLPEKCTIAEISYAIFCATPDSLADASPMPDKWYRGEVSFSDSIWQIRDGDATLIVSMQMLSEQEVDVSRLSFSLGGDTLYFTNKKDNSLWMYEI